MTAPPNPTLRSDLLARWLDEIRATSARARELTRGLTPAQMSRRRSDGGWSVAQVFEHLVVSHSLYMDAMERVMDRTQPAPVAREWSPSLFGRFLIGGLSPQSKSRWPAPKIFRPGPEARENVVEAFLATQERLERLLRRADRLDFARLRMSSPVSRFIRMNLGDGFRILTVHGQRHLLQVERTVAEPLPRELTHPAATRSRAR